MKVWHYSQVLEWGSQKGVNSRERGIGLSPRLNRRLGQRAIFALFDPLPKKWIENPVFPQAWQLLLEHIGHLLLEIDVDPQRDRVFVTDAGYYVAADYTLNREIAPKKYQRWYPELIGSYQSSMVPLATYQQRRTRLSYALPEVVFLEDLPLERVHVSQEQPLINWILQLRREGRVTFEDQFIEAFGRIPELREAYESYGYQAQESVTRGGSKERI